MGEYLYDIPVGNNFLNKAQITNHKRLIILVVLKFKTYKTHKEQSEKTSHRAEGDIVHTFN